MTTPRCIHELVALDNCFYALGGYSDKYTSSVEKFDVKSQKWTAGPSMLEERGYFGAIVADM